MGMPPNPIVIQLNQEPESQGKATALQLYREDLPLDQIVLLCWKYCGELDATLFYRGAIVHFFKTKPIHHSCQAGEVIVLAYTVKAWAPFGNPATPVSIQ